MLIKKIGILVMMVMVLVGCREEVSVPTGLEISLCMPAGDFLSSRQRVMGDPGLTEHFDLPEYAYIFVLMERNGEMTIWKKYNLILDAGKWEMKRYSGAWNTAGDSIFSYSESLHINLKGETPVGDVYAICSNTALTFDRDLNDVETRADVLNLKINTNSADIQGNLQNIYSTPYNYTVGEENKYYCSYVTNSKYAVKVDLLMYHIASKVDLKWSVPDSVRINRADTTKAVRLTYLEAQQLFDGWAYAFKPMENIVDAMPNPGRVITDIVTRNDEGLWWEGRTYFYTIPFKLSSEVNYFPIQLKMETNRTGDYYNVKIKQRVTDEVFVPWIRGNIIISKPLSQDVTRETE